MIKLKNLIKLSLNKRKAKIVFKNGNIVNVFTNEIIKADVAMSDNKIVGIGSYEGEKEIDLKNKFIVPGLIDSHLHIESTMLTPGEFCKAVLPRGTTSVIADPHEIANVCGMNGIKYMIEESKNLPMDIYYMLPSCVPCTEKNETSGAKLYAKDLEELINEDIILGLGEMMNYPGVIYQDKDVLDKLDLARRNNKIVDGHGPHIKDKELNAYVISGVNTDHECSTQEEMLNRLRLGMYIMIREGSAAKNLRTLIKAVDKNNLNRCLLCTDDKHPKDIIEEGHISNSIKIAVEEGVDPIDAIKMATINPATCYNLKNKGAIAPGYDADILIVDNLKDFNIEKVYKSGKLVGENSEALFDIEMDNKYLGSVLNSVNIKEVKKSDLEISLSTNKANIIELLPHSLVTKKSIKEVSIKDNKFIFEKNIDILKMAIIERHHKSGNIGLALVENFKLKNGAIGCTVAHDSHNIIVIGDSDESILAVVEKIKENNGGIAIAYNNEVVESLPLEIGGLMSNRSIKYVKSKLEKIIKIAYEDLCVNKDIDPFMTLSFLALPVIGDLKLTDKGLFDVTKFQFINIDPMKS